MTNKKTNGARAEVPSERRGASPGTASPSQVASPVNPKPLIPAQSPKK